MGHWDLKRGKGEWGSGRVGEWGTSWRLGDKEDKETKT